MIATDLTVLVVDNDPQVLEVAATACEQIGLTDLLDADLCAAIRRQIDFRGRAKRVAAIRRLLE
jgi:hypothetical protein